MWAHLARAQNGCTALILAAGQGHADCARLLLDAGADKEAKMNVRRGVVEYIPCFFRFTIFFGGSECENDTAFARTCLHCMIARMSFDRVCRCVDMRCHF